MAGAYAKIDTHEKVCAERYGNLIERFNGLDRNVTRILWSLAAGAVVLIGYLLVLVIPGLKP